MIFLSKRFYIVKILWKFPCRPQMFLSRMVNGLLNSNKHNNCYNHNQPQHQQQSISSTNPIKLAKKSHKKPDKGRRPDSKKTITEFFKSSAKDSIAYDPMLHQPSTSKATLGTAEFTTKSLGPTKVKSASWKRSDKSSSSFNNLANKKTKTLRRRSPNWLKFPNASVKIAEHIIDDSDTNAACRPGTLYSDVLFGAAGSSSMIKVKSLTPRRCGDTAQNKLVKALFKFSSEKNNDPDSGEGELETQRNIFPSLHKLPHVKTGTDSTATLKTTTSPNDSSNSGDSHANSTATASRDSYEEADVVILTDRNDKHSEPHEVTYGNYLDQQLDTAAANPLNTNDSTSDCCQENPSRPRSQFRIDIPQWNFTEIDLGPDAFPKFMCQFDDERYLKAEKLALLSLNLALGTTTGQSKLKF